MTLQSQELFGNAVQQTPNLRAFPREDGIRPGTLVSYSPARSLPNLTPLYFDDVAQLWEVWVGSSNEVNTITANATPATAGTFTLTVNGQTTAGIAFNANAAAVQAALEALSNVAPGDVVGVDSGPGSNLGTGSHVVTLTWGGTYAGQDVTITANMAGLTGNPHVFATPTPGGAAPSDGGLIDGFLWAPVEPHQSSAAGETLVQVFRRGLIHRDDIPVPSGESQTNLDSALRSSSLREKGIDVQGLSGIH
jgi:hypothetical protein